MDLESLDFYVVFDLFFLLLIGMGPKIALVPFLDLTAGMEKEMQKKVAGQMVKTAVGVALVLVFLGSLLMRLLHFSPGAVSIAGGIILMLLALHMLIGAGGSEEHKKKAASRDPMQMALYPLAVPYLLNPAGIAVLVTVSDQLDSLLMIALVAGLVLLMGALDMAVFKNMDKLAKHLDPSRLMVTEAVFGVLLAALAVQLVLDGLETSGIISGLPGH